MAVVDEHDREDDSPEGELIEAVEMVIGPPVADAAKVAEAGVADPSELSPAATRAAAPALAQ
jgi:hypothetical protein